MLDPLGMVQRKVRATFDDDSDGLADAPHTIAQREELQRTTGENYFYSPHLGQVPEIEVPDFLPDLLGELITRPSAIYLVFIFSFDTVVIMDKLLKREYVATLFKKNYIVEYVLC